MKKKYTHLFIIFIFLFTSCLAIPGYVDKDGNITPSYLKQIKMDIESMLVNFKKVEIIKIILIKK